MGRRWRPAAMGRLWGQAMVVWCIQAQMGQVYAVAQSEGQGPSFSILRQRLEGTSGLGGCLGDPPSGTGAGAPQLGQSGSGRREPPTQGGGQGRQAPHGGLRESQAVGSVSNGAEELLYKKHLATLDRLEQETAEATAQEANARDLLARAMEGVAARSASQKQAMTAWEQLFGGIPGGRCHGVGLGHHRSPAGRDLPGGPFHFECSACRSCFCWHFWADYIDSTGRSRGAPSLLCKLPKCGPTRSIPSCHPSCRRRGQPTGGQSTRWSSCGWWATHGTFRGAHLANGRRIYRCRPCAQSQSWDQGIDEDWAAPFLTAHGVTCRQAAGGQAQCAKTLRHPGHSAGGHASPDGLRVWGGYGHRIRSRPPAGEPSHPGSSHTTIDLESDELSAAFPGLGRLDH